MSSSKLITGPGDFRSQISQKKLVVIDFFASWCGPCKAIAPAFERFAQRYPSVGFYKVNVDDCQDVAKSCNVASMPTFLFYRAGVRVDSLSGADERELESKIKQHMVDLKFHGKGNTLSSSKTTTNNKQTTVVAATTTSSVFDQIKKSICETPPFFLILFLVLLWYWWNQNN